MPIFDFQCTKCGHKDELLRKSSASDTAICPICNTETFSKMLSAPSFQLNGSGWYATDFKDKKPKSATEKASTEAAKTSVDAPVASS
jgi:putative FmdB family regulatory protein